MTKGKLFFLSNPFCDERRLLRCFPNVVFKDNSWILSLYFRTWLLFTCDKFHSSRLTMHSLRNRINSVGQGFGNWILHARKKCWNAWRVERMSVFIVQIFQMLQVVGYIKIWWNISAVCAVAWAIVCSRRQINQQKKKRYRFCILIPVNESCWSKSQLYTYCSNLMHLSRGLKKTMCVFCSSTSLPGLFWLIRLCLMYIVLNSQCLPAEAMSTNSLELQISAYESSKMSRYLVLLFFKELINSKCTPWTNSRLSISFCMTP